MLIIDSHQDLAWNILAHGRDYTRSVMETRQIEAGTSIPKNSGDSIVGWPEYQRGRVAIVFSTLYATPAKKKELFDTIVYKDAEAAHRLYRDQVDVYRKLTDSHPDKFRLITSTPELDSVICVIQYNRLLEKK